MEYNINYGQHAGHLNIDRIEKKYNAQYVGDFCLRTVSGTWAESPAAVFWQETPPVEGYSNYFGIIVRSGVPYITSGASAFEKPIQAMVAKNGEVIYSRWRHDYRSSRDGTVTVDGGRDYMRTLFSADYVPVGVELIADGPRLKVVDGTEKKCVTPDSIQQSDTRLV